MTFEPVHLQIAGIGIVVLIALLMLWWVARMALGWHGGKAVYVLPEPRDDDEDSDEDDGIEVR